MLSLCIVCGRYPKAVIRTFTQYRENIANPESLVTFNQPPLHTLPPPINVMSVSLSLAGFWGWFPVVGSSLPASHFRLLAADYCTFLRCRLRSLKQTTIQVTSIIYALHNMLQVTTCIWHVRTSLTAVYSSSFIALFMFVSRLRAFESKKYGSKHYLPLELALPLNRFSLLIWLNTPGMRWFAHQRFNRLYLRLCLLKVFTTRLLRNDLRTFRKWELGQTGCLLNLGSSSYFWFEPLSVSCENCSVFRVQLHRGCCPLPPP